MAEPKAIPVPGMTPARGGTRPKDRHALALRSIRDFLRGRSSYDVLPVSFRLIVLDTKLVVKPALDVMWQAGVVSAPLWQSTRPELLGATPDTEVPPPSSPPPPPPPPAPAPARAAAAAADQDAGQVSPKSQSVPPPHQDQESQSGFAGMLTVNDIIHLIQYYYQNSSYDSAAEDVEKFRLERLRDIEQALNVPPPPLLSVHPLRPLFDACELLMKTHARRLPLLDYDEQTGIETVVSVLTQYRVLKFIAMNCRETSALWRSIKSLGIGTYIAEGEGAGAGAGGSYFPLATATLDTTVFDVVHMFSERGISAVPIVDAAGMVVDLYETVDVITLVRTGAYTALDLTIRQALERRPPDFQGIWTCSPDDSLANIFALLRKARVHRLLVLQNTQARLPDQDTPTRQPGKLVGIVCLSDILKYVIGSQTPKSRGESVASSSTRAGRSSSNTPSVAE